MHVHVILKWQQVELPHWQVRGGGGVTVTIIDSIFLCWNPFN
jgi:hypothetical protein